MVTWLAMPYASRVHKIYSKKQSRGFEFHLTLPCVRVGPVQKYKKNKDALVNIAMAGTALFLATRRHQMLCRFPFYHQLFLGTTGT